MLSGLPVHVNASFQVAKNRRSLWLNSDGELDGQHKASAAWNDVLQRSSLPALWLEVLKDMTLRHCKTGERRDDDSVCDAALARAVFEVRSRQSSDGVGAKSIAKELRAKGWPKVGAKEVRDIFACTTAEPQSPTTVFHLLPHFGTVHDAWKICATELYQQMAQVRILPHMSASLPWVGPAGAFVVDMPTPAFTGQCDKLMQLYSRSTRWDEYALGPIVCLPEHVKAPCVDHSGLHTISVADFVPFLLKHRSMSQLSHVLIALAEHADEWPQWQKGDWKCKLAHQAW